MGLPMETREPPAVVESDGKGKRMEYGRCCCRGSPSHQGVEMSGATGTRGIGSACGGSSRSRKVRDHADASVVPRVRRTFRFSADTIGFST